MNGYFREETSCRGFTSLKTALGPRTEVWERFSFVLCLIWSSLCIRDDLFSATSAKPDNASQHYLEILRGSQSDSLHWPTPEILYFSAGSAHVWCAFPFTFISFAGFFLMRVQHVDASVKAWVFGKALMDNSHAEKHVYTLWLSYCMCLKLVMADVSI